MPVTLTKYPVISESGKVKNIFAGFDAVEVEFFRKDFDLISVSQGVDNKILINVPAADITSDLNVGEWLYLSANGNTFDYDNSYQIIDISFANPNTEITVKGDFVENASGYINYKQNWFLESKLVDPNNGLIFAYPSLLQNDGNPNGEVNVNVSMLVDFLKNDILETSQEITTSRKNCRLEYREVWRENQTEDFVDIAGVDPIIIIFSAENTEVESFVSNFELPRMWAGYPFNLNLLHSTANYPGERFVVKFDELDINKANITTENNLSIFAPSDFGILQTNFEDKTKIIESNTKYIKFNASVSTIGDYKAGDYKTGDYKTGV